MRTLINLALLAGAGIAVIIGGFCFVGSMMTNSALHEIEAILCFLIAAVLFSAFAVNFTLSDPLDRLVGPKKTGPSGADPQASR